MAINLDDRYPGRANGKTLDYPQGSFKNRTAPNSNDGTYLEQDWANDQLAFFQSLIADAGLTPNNLVDTVQASQYFDALMMAVGNRFPKFATFAEIVALTQDEGPIICTDMGCGFYVWTTSAYFTGYRSVRCGEWLDGWTPTPLSWMLEAYGGTWSESDPKEARVISRYRESGLTVASGSWIKGQNMIADLGGGDWKAPDLQDMFKRMTGTDADTANARQAGSWQKGSLVSFDSTVNSIAIVGLRSYTDMLGASQFGLDKVSNLNEYSPINGSVIGGSSQPIDHTFSGVTRPVNTAILPFICI